MAMLNREIMNAVSDIIMNRPLPIREVDQIYMKAGDLALQSFFIGQRFRDLDVVFIGDGDAVALSTMYLFHCDLLDVAPKSIHLLDFDERIVNSVIRFADKYRFTNRISASLYNVIDPLPSTHQRRYDAFYTNPPWGASNEGESVKAFVERGIQATRDHNAQGAIVIGDDPALVWTQEVLHVIQEASLGEDFIVSEMVPAVHNYHLDDAPHLRSCNCLVRRARQRTGTYSSEALSPDRYARFYGRNNPLRIRYIREELSLNVGRAVDQTYKLEFLEGKS